MSPRSTRATTRRALAFTLVSALCFVVLLSLIALNVNHNNYNSTSHETDISWLDYDHDAESRAEAVRVPQIVSYEAVALPEDVHIFHSDGEVVVGIDAPRHPVLHILDHANAEWESIVKAHGGDQERAIQQYRLSNKPASDTADSKTRMRSPLHLFNPIPPSLLELRQHEAAILPDTFTLTLHSGVPRITYGNLSQSVSQEARARRVENLLTAIKPFAKSLPDLRATFSLLSHPRQALPHQASDVLEALSANQPLPRSPFKFRSQAEPASPEVLPHGRLIHEDDLTRLEGIMTTPAHWSWQDACRAKYDMEEAPEDEEQQSGLPQAIRFVGFPKTRSDPCVHRTLMELHPFFETIGSTYLKRISPIVSDTSAPWANDILLPPLDFFSPQDTLRTVPWENKTSGIFWHGPLTAEHPTQPASRLVHLFNVEANENEQELVLPAENEGDEGFHIDRKLLSDVFTYYIQPGTDENEAKVEEAGWKFLVDLGEGMRMRERMASGGLVFRPLLLGDWFSERSVPWVHYVPVQPDLSDLPSLIAFFKQHDGLARRIAEAGQSWAREQLSLERARNSVRDVLEGFGNLQGVAQ